MKNIIYIGDKKPVPTQIIQELSQKKFNVLSFDQLEVNGAKMPVCDFPPPNPEDNFLIMYTSGTTGNPKGFLKKTTI